MILTRKCLCALALLAIYCAQGLYAQKKIEDKAMRYQQERMVYKQWDKGKFEPGSGFLGLNPYYWLTWGLHPNYPDTDRRPLSAWGPQTQRLGLVGAMNQSSAAYKLESDTLRNTALLEIAGYSGAVSAADPLWLIYYSKELKPVLEFSEAALLAPLKPAVRAKVIAEGTLAWYQQELAMLKERVDGARSADLERGARIIAYHRLLQEYRNPAGSWSSRTATAEANLKKADQREQLHAGEVSIAIWSAGRDEEIAREVLRQRKY